MATLLIILLSTVLIQNSAVVTGSDRPPTVHARGVLTQEFHHALFVILTLAAASILGFCVEHYWLAPRALTYLRTPVLLVLVALIFAAARATARTAQAAPPWPRFLAYATNHCALLGVALFAALNLDDLGSAIAYGFGAGALLSLLGAAYADLRDRFAHDGVPFVFRGVPIALITAGLMALALLGFAGLVRS